MRDCHPPPHTGGSRRREPGGRVRPSPGRVQLSKSRIGLFGWISEQAFRGVLVYGRPGGSVEAGTARGPSGSATLVIAPRWGLEDGWGRSQPSPLSWAEGARAFGPEGRRVFRGLVASESEFTFRREVGLRPEGADLTQPRASPWVSGERSVPRRPEGPRSGRAAAGSASRGGWAPPESAPRGIRRAPAAPNPPSPPCEARMPPFGANRPPRKAASHLRLRRSLSQGALRRLDARAPGCVDDPSARLRSHGEPRLGSLTNDGLRSR
jgi:hypothetical protein